MLTAKISIDRNFGLYTETGHPPGGPEKVIRVDVNFAPPKKLISGWLRIHALDRARKGYVSTIGKLIAALVISLALIFLLVWAQLHQRNLVASLPSSEITKEQGHSEKSKRKLHGENLLSDLWASDEVWTLSFWLRSLGIAAGLALIFGSIVVSLVNDRSLLRIYLIVLEPHEPFPVVDRRLRGQNVYVYAVRALGVDVRIRFFKLWDQDDPKLTSIGTTSLHVTHQHSRAISPTDSRVDPVSYWTLIRFAISRTLPQRETGTAQAMRITYKQNAGLFFSYLMLVGIAIGLPSVGWVAPAEATQFPLIMAGLGAGWALVAAFLHRSKSVHLAEWERRTLEYPFRGCPIFWYNNESSSDGEWNLLHKDDFQTRVRNFGMEFAALQQFVLGVMLVLYFTILALIK